VSSRSARPRSHTRCKAEEIFGAVDEVTVFGVVPDSPAAKAGLRKGDRIVSVNGTSTPKTQQVFAALRAEPDRAPELSVLRGDVALELKLERVAGCHHGLFVGVGGTPGTFGHSNGEELLIPNGLSIFVQNDDEFAIAIAHQIAHHVLGSGRRPRPADEPPADRLGLRIAHAAGFDVRAAPAFWDRVATELPWKITSNTDYGFHLDIARRSPMIREAVTEILAEAATGAAGN